MATGLLALTTIATVVTSAPPPAFAVPAPPAVTAAPATRTAAPSTVMLQSAPSPKKYAASYGRTKYHWGAKEFKALNTLWKHESGWRVNAKNSSGAYGIPQALPGKKMASAGKDWRTNPRTQIRWGLGYIKKRYGHPVAALKFWQQHGYY